MGQTCSQNCTYPRVNGSRSGAPGAPKLSAAPLRGFGGPGLPAEEPAVHFHASSFQVSVSAASSGAPSPVQNGVAQATASPPTGALPAGRLGWRSCYSLGPLLGDGISAKVFEAEALDVGTAARHAAALDAASLWSTCGAIAMPHCLRERGRRVAIKRYKRAGSRTYLKELAALRRVGVFPHVLRLLESFEGVDGEDVLVLEYCDGSTLYDLYAREHPNGGLPERLVARIIRQLLLALQHLSSCDIEHQDVKPENMMLHDVNIASGQCELKLGDFGWACLLPPPGSTAPRAKVPSTGAGSLWYAPPELNPPPPGCPPMEPDLPHVQGDGQPGRSDMWSVGVVLYLLLVGHNPFNTALKQSTPEAVDNEVLRLAALGQFNRRTEKWLNLHMDARDFISVLLRVRAPARPSAAEALNHPFLSRRWAKSCEPSVFFNGQLSVGSDREAAWRRLDGFQRLAWLAVARAVAEPELDRSIIAAALEGLEGGGAPGCSREAAYLWQLARELGTTPVFQWLQDRSAWTEILRLAFAYLDADSDGLLTPGDLAAHVSVPGTRSDDVCAEDAPVSTSSTAWSAACRWIARWQDPQASPAQTVAGGQPGLLLPSFREALLWSCAGDDNFLSALDVSAHDHLASARGCGTTDKPVGHDEEEINWTNMVPHSSGV